MVVVTRAVNKQAQNKTCTTLTRTIITIITQCLDQSIANCVVMAETLNYVALFDIQTKDCRCVTLQSLELPSTYCCRKHVLS
jgi:hypothetical protein